MSFKKESTTRHSSCLWSTSSGSLIRRKAASHCRRRLPQANGRTPRGGTIVPDSAASTEALIRTGRTWPSRGRLSAGTCRAGANHEMDRIDRVPPQPNERNRT